MYILHFTCVNQTNIRYTNQSHTLHQARSFATPSAAEKQMLDAHRKFGLFFR